MTTEQKNPQSSAHSPQSSSGTEVPQSSVLSPQNCNQQSTLLITGGCGFIGVNLLDFMLKKGFTHFRILDNLSVGKIENLESVLSKHGHFEKKEEDREFIYSMPCPLSDKSTDLSPQSFSGTEAPEPSALSPQSSQAPHVELVLGDVRNPKDCIQATERVDAIVHLAAQSGVPSSVENPVFDCETNVLGTLNVLEACRKNNVDKFIFASSGAPLGEVEPPIHEKKLPRPISPYGASKLAGEAYCNAYYKTFGIKTVVLRFGNVYGPRSSHKTSVVAKFFKRALEGKPLEIYGDGSQTRDFIYTEDLCNAIFLALSKLGFSPEHSTESSDLGPQSSSGTEAPQSSVPSPQSSRNIVSGQIFQIATFKETTVSEIAERIKELVESENGNSVNVIHSEIRLGDVKRNYSDISKAINLLKFNPKYELDTGLSETWKAFLLAL